MKSLHLLFIFFLFPALFACNGFSNRKTPLYKIPPDPKSILSTELQTQFNNGYDYIASGESIAPWKVEINFDDSIHFHSQDGLSFTIPATRPLVNKDSSLQFTSSLSLGKVVITINKGACNNGQFLNETTQNQCSISIGKINYTGCGQFLYNPQLEGKWFLQQYKDVSISESLFKNGIPFLNFDILKHKVNGFDGCNVVSGNAEIQGKRIAFNNMVTTKKLCKDSPLPNLFSILDKQYPRYKILNNLLYFYLIDDSIIILKKSS